MVLLMSEVASCIKCKEGITYIIEIFEIACSETCASKLVQVQCVVQLQDLHECGRNQF